MSEKIDAAIGDNEADTQESSAVPEAIAEATVGEEGVVEVAVGAAEAELGSATADSDEGDALSDDPAARHESADTDIEKSEDESSDSDDSDSNRVVRMLAVGQQVDGVVRRVTEFGAFVDIGVGRDGLIHISELSPGRVAKVSDVLSEKQEIRPWIKKLDRKRNRISLTLIDPEMKTIRDIEQGEVVQGTVTRILPYGAFVDIGIGRDALLHVREMSNGFVEKPEDVVKAGETLEVRVIEVSRRRGRVDLSLKGLRDEPEAEEAIETELVEEELVEEVDQFEGVEVLSPMELAFKKAVEADGDEIRVPKKKSGKRDRRSDTRSIQDEIIARTLDANRK